MLLKSWVWLYPDLRQDAIRGSYSIHLVKHDPWLPLAYGYQCTSWVEFLADRCIFHLVRCAFSIPSGCNFVPNQWGRLKYRGVIELDEAVSDLLCLCTHNTQCHTNVLTPLKITLSNKPATVQYKAKLAPSIHFIIFN
jgi:hypothetical protein